MSSAAAPIAVGISRNDHPAWPWKMITGLLPAGG